MWRMALLLNISKLIDVLDKATRKSIFYSNYHNYMQKQMAQDAKFVTKLDILTHIKHFECYFSFALKCGEWAHLCATNVAKE